LEWARAEFTRCSPWIEAALEGTLGEYDLPHVWVRIEEGSAQIWPAPNAVVITTINDYPTGLRVCFIWLAGGSLTEIKAMEPALTEWAEITGCKHFITDGREGWGRTFGGRKLYSRFVKDI
jgi:hypothetical protein